MAVNDSWIAATVLALGVPVVTQDDDYVDIRNAPRRDKIRPTLLHDGLGIMDQEPSSVPKGSLRAIVNVAPNGCNDRESRDGDVHRWADHVSSELLDLFDALVRVGNPERDGPSRVSSSPDAGACTAPISTFPSEKAARSVKPGTSMLVQPNRLP